MVTIEEETVEGEGIEEAEAEEEEIEVIVVDEAAEVEIEDNEENEDRDNKKEKEAKEEVEAIVEVEAEIGTIKDREGIVPEEIEDKENSERRCLTWIRKQARLPATNKTANIGSSKKSKVKIFLFRTIYP